MRNVLEFCLLGLSAVVITLLACWGWWELQHWWQLRRHRDPSSRTRWNDDQD